VQKFIGEKMKKYVLFLLVASLVLSGCASQGKSLEGSWTLTSYGPGASPIPSVADSQASITFNNDGTISGNSGCNSFGGEYKVDGDQVTFNALVSTLMACSEPLMAQEGIVYQVLNGTASYEIKGEILTISNNGMVLVYTAA